MNMKKVFAVAIIILIIGMSVNLSSAVENLGKSSILLLNGNTLYVGGSGSGNYSTIQDAINNASDGDTIFVFNGTYNERLYVNKSINLIGENKTSTIIEGFGFDNVVKIVNSWVSIQNFYINNSGHFVPDSGIKIYGEIHNITIQNNIITNNNIGICIGDEYLYKRIEHVTIESNLIQNNRFGVKLFICYNNRISNNTFIGNGLVIPKAYTRDNIVINNTVNGKPLIFLFKQSNKIIKPNVGQIILVSCDNITISSQSFDKTCDVCIELFGCSNCNIIKNNISNKYYGVFCLNSENNNIQENLMDNVTCGIYFVGSERLTLSFNTINNSRYSIYCYKSNRNSISYNSISNCHIGLYLLYSNYNIISNNLINNCSKNGIDLFYSCNFNQFLNNTINNSWYSGIYILGSTQIRWDFASNMNVISGNNIKNNRWGIFLEEASITTVTLNNIARNRYGIEVISARLSRIFKNNIFDNEKEDALLKNSFTSRFNRNFWNETKRVHIIKGGIYRYDFWGEIYIEIFPLLRFDWHAVKEPYNIGV